MKTEIWRRNVKSIYSGVISNNGWKINRGKCLWKRNENISKAGGVSSAYQLAKMKAKANSSNQREMKWRLKAGVKQAMANVMQPKENGQKWKQAAISIQYSWQSAKYQWRSGKAKPEKGSESYQKTVFSVKALSPKLAAMATESYRQLTKAVKISADRRESNIKHARQMSKRNGNQPEKEKAVEWRNIEAMKKMSKQWRNRRKCVSGWKRKAGEEKAIKHLNSL